MALIIFTVISSVSAMLFLVLPLLASRSGTCHRRERQFWGVCGGHERVPSWPGKEGGRTRMLREYQHAAVGFNASSDPIRETDVINGEALWATETRLPSEHTISSAIPASPFTGNIANFTAVSHLATSKESFYFL